jgi:hypothetical protein
MTTYAVIATNHSHSYQFFAPLTALMWREVVGFNTLCFLTGNERDWQDKAAKLVASKVQEVGARVQYIGLLEGYRDSQAAQSSRQHAAALDLPESDLLMTGDIDMWPLSREWFRQFDLDGYDFASFYSNAYGWPHPPFLPTPYIVATVKNWRKVMQLECRGEILTQMQANFDRTLGRYHDSWTAWWQDEVYFNSKLREWDGWPKRVQMITRDGCPPHDRIDRGCWPAVIDWSKPLADTHLVRPGATPENWSRIRPILEHFVPDHMDWVDSYHRAYSEAKYNA